MSLDIHDFYLECLDISRKSLLTAGCEDNEAARDLIIRTVFDHPEAEKCTREELSCVIDKIYLMIRGKLGILDPLAEDDEVNEIMVNGKDDIFYEKNGKVLRYDMNFDTTEDLEEVIRDIASKVHREINELNPIVDARLEDGSRVSGVYRNVAINGPILTIRKFSDDFMSMEDLVNNGTVTEEQSRFLEALVSCGYNLFISGGTSSGKTTLLNALSAAVPSGERVIVIEDSMELKLKHIENIVHMECRSANSRGKGLVSMSDLIRASLRMRPDRIIVGEVRGAEVAEMLQAMNTGHPGSMSTGHGNSVTGMLKRLESMYLMGVSLNVDAIREQIAEGIDVMIHVEREKDGRRHITEVREIMGYEDGHFLLHDLTEENSKGLIQLDKAERKGEGYAEILAGSVFNKPGNRDTVL